MRAAEKAEESVDGRCSQKRKRQSSVPIESKSASSSNVSDASTSTSDLPSTALSLLPPNLSAKPVSKGRPSKRIRMSEASVVCMREIFRAIVKDGDITEEERLVLQNTSLLLSQVSGQTWVNFPDCDGSLKDLAAPHLRQVRPFLEKVARELKEKETSLDSIDAATNNEEQLVDCLRLSDVPWAEGITADELLRCCQPDQEMLISNKLLEQVVSELPTQYMLRSRMLELLNYYYLRWGCQRQGSRRRCFLPAIAAAANFGSSSLAESARASQSCLDIVFAPALAAVACLVASVVRLLLAALLLATSLASLLLQRCRRRGERREPVWPALRFFAAAALHSEAEEVGSLLVMVARFRIVLCLSACSPFFGWLFFPLVAVVEQVLDVERENPFIGCSCHGEGEPSLISWLPIKGCEVLVGALKLVRFAPLMEFWTEPFVRFVDLLHPVLSFLCDLVFSVGLAQGLGRVVNLADEQAQGRLVWMSMGIARRVREAPKDGTMPTPLPAGNTNI